MLNYEDFQLHIVDVDKSILAVDQQISDLSNELSKQQIIQKRCASYRICREILEKAKTASDKNAFKADHISEYKLHDVLKRDLLKMGIKKLPAPENQQAIINKLESQHSIAVKEKQELQKRQATLQIIKENFENMLLSFGREPANIDQMLSI